MTRGTFISFQLVTCPTPVVSDYPLNITMWIGGACGFNGTGKPFMIYGTCARSANRFVTGTFIHLFVGPTVNKLRPAYYPRGFSFNISVEGSLLTSIVPQPVQCSVNYTVYPSEFINSSLVICMLPDSLEYGYYEVRVSADAGATWSRPLGLVIYGM